MFVFAVGGWVGGWAHAARVPAVLRQAAVRTFWTGWLLGLVVAVIIYRQNPSDDRRERPRGRLARLAAAGGVFGLITATLLPRFWIHGEVFILSFASGFPATLIACAMIQIIQDARRHRHTSH